MLAVPAGVLCSALASVASLLGLVWMGGAGAWAVRLYAKRTHASWLSSGTGARIGLMTGLFASWLTIGVNSIDLWVARYVLHQGGAMDSLWNSQMNDVLKMSQQMLIQMGISTAEAAQSTQMYRLWVFSSEGRATDVLTKLLTGATFLALFAMLGGALGARFLAQPRRP